MKPRSKQETHYIYVPQFNYLFNWFCYIHFAPHKISLFTKPTFLNFNLMHLACYDLPPKEIFNIFFFFFYIYIFFHLFKYEKKDSKHAHNHIFFSSATTGKLTQPMSTLHVSSKSSINTYNWNALSLMHLLQTPANRYS
jgi:hypothetical protein